MVCYSLSSPPGLVSISYKPGSLDSFGLHDVFGASFQLKLLD